MISSNTKLFLIKSIHTLIWILFVSVIAYILWCGITNTISIYSWLAVAAVCVEGAILLIFKGSCPLTIMARRYSSSQKNNFDIYLPDWLAKYNKLIFGSLFCIGLALLLYRIATA